jgi:hypothetical protein
MRCRATPKLKISSNFETLGHKHTAHAKEKGVGSNCRKIVLLYFLPRPADYKSRIRLYLPFRS